MRDKPISKPTIKLADDIKIEVAGYFCNRDILVKAPGNFEINEMYAELVRTLNVQERSFEQRWNMTTVLPSNNTGKFARKVLLTSREHFDIPTQNTGNINVEWRIETRVSLTHDAAIKDGRRKSSNSRETKTISSIFPIRVVRGG